MRTERFNILKMGQRKLKNYATGIVSCALLIALASCDRNGQLPVESDLPGEKAELEVSRIGLDDTAENRAPSVSGIPTSADVGFYLKGDNGYTQVYNRKGNYDATKSAWIPNTTIFLGSNTATLAIYYPYDNAQSTTTGKLALTSVLREKSASDHSSRTDKDIWSDCFTANLLSCFGTNKITRDLKHIYTRMLITLVKDATFIGNGDWTKVELAGAGVYRTASFNPLEATKLNAYSGHSTSGFSCTFDAKTVSATASPTTDLLLVPTTDMSSDMELTVTVSGKAMKVTIPKEKFTEVTSGSYRMLPEKQYNLTIILRPTDLEVATLNTTDWEPVTVSGDHGTTN